jgi:hypothetical protein
MSEELGVADEPVDCFTWNFKEFGEIKGTTDGRKPFGVYHI